MRRNRRIFTSILIVFPVALLLTSCGGTSYEPGRETVTLEWMESESTLNRQPEKRAWKPADLTGPGTFGRHPWVLSQDDRAYIWSHLSMTRFPMDIVESTDRTLALDGFPAPSPDGLPQQVEVRVDDVPVGTLEWSDTARHLLPVPAALIPPGRHTVSLHYRYTADAPGGGRGSELRGMAWHAIELLGPEALRSAPAATATVQPGPSVWWQFVPLSTPVEWTVRGRPRSEGTRLAFWIDRGDGRWEEIGRREPGQSGTVRFQQSLEGAAGSVARLGVAVLAGAMEWEEVSVAIQQMPERRPIVLVTLDTTRRDALGSYADNAQTPHLDRLAANGLVFDQAYTPTPATGPAHATVFLSQDPARHGVVTNGQHLPPANGGHLAVQAKALGYETAGFVSLGTVAADLGFAQGFDRFNDHFDHDWWRFAAQVNEQVLPWINEHPQSAGRPPGFLWVHYSDPHRPYGTADEPGQRIVLELNGEVLDTADTLGLSQSWPLVIQPGRNRLTLSAPRTFDDDRQHWYILRDFSVSGPEAGISLGQEWRTVRNFPRMREQGTLWIDSTSDQKQKITLNLRVEDNPTEQEARLRYAQEVTAVDTALGQLLERLEANGWLDRGLVFVFSDHGEDLGEGGHFGHVHHLGPTLTQVPMLLWGAGVEKGRVDGLTGLIDVAPTLWGVMNLPPSPDWEGENALLSPPDRRLYLETFTPEADRHLRRLIELPYSVSGEVGADIEDLVALDVSDGSEQRLDIQNLDVEASWKVDEMFEAWLQWDVGQHDPSPIPAEVLERLRSLGYIQ